MTDKEREKSYERYKQWQYNKNRYKHESLTYVLIFGFCFFAVLKNWDAVPFVVVTAVVILIGMVLYKKFRSNKQSRMETTGTESVEVKTDSNLKTEIHKTVAENAHMKSTETGYVNQNNQRNNGKTNKPGSGNNQWFYDMECLNCEHKYLANGHDIWLRKCPKCQGGKP